MTSRIAIIPARGGSKRIPHKNIKPFFGKPIIAYSIKAALDSGCFDTVMVSTDSEEIAQVARQFEAQVPFMRSAKTSDDFATTGDVMLEVLDRYAENGKFFDTIACIYATAPFVSAESILGAMDLMETRHFDSVFTAVAYSYPVQRSLRMRDHRIEMRYPEYKNARSQDLEPVYHDAGQFYISNVEAFRREKGFWGRNTGALVLSELEVQDLDTETDWKLAELKYGLLHGDK